MMTEQLLESKLAVHLSLNSCFPIQKFMGVVYLN